MLKTFWCGFKISLVAFKMGWILEEGRGWLIAREKGETKKPSTFSLGVVLAFIPKKSAVFRAGTVRTAPIVCFLCSWDLEAIVDHCSRFWTPPSDFGKGDLGDVPNSDTMGSPGSFWASPSLGSCNCKQSSDHLPPAYLIRILWGLMRLSLQSDCLII